MSRSREHLVLPISEPVDDWCINLEPPGPDGPEDSEADLVGGAFAPAFPLLPLLLLEAEGEVGGRLGDLLRLSLTEADMLVYIYWLCRQHCLSMYVTVTLTSLMFQSVLTIL